jgi:EAL domain-containing protein (putative c-di-GMP-specific phosphodiesterase class I)
MSSPDVTLSYLPILDVARGTAAGYETVYRSGSAADPDLHVSESTAPGQEGRLAARTVSLALAAAATLPANTFLTVPMAVGVAASAAVRSVLRDHGSLAGVVLDIVGPIGPAPDPALEATVATYRAAGALISVGGQGAAQPELTSIVRLKPAVLRLGRDWVRGVDTSKAKHSAVELIGRLADQLDAWILAEGVSTAAELRALAGLAVPLAQGPFIGAAQVGWPQITAHAKTVLPLADKAPDGVLRGLLQPAYTTTDARAAVLPGQRGFDVVVVVDERRRPSVLLEPDGAGGWTKSDVLTVNVDTPLPDAVRRAMTRPRTARYSPLVCTDEAGRFLGILSIDRLVTHLVDDI